MNVAVREDFVTNVAAVSLPLLFLHSALLTSCGSSISSDIIDSRMSNSAASKSFNSAASKFMGWRRMGVR